MLVLRISEAFKNMSAAYDWATKQKQCVNSGASLYLTWSDKPKGWFVYRSEIPTDWTNKNIVHSSSKSSRVLSVVESWAMDGDIEPLTEKHISLDKARNMLAAGINSRYTSKYKEKI